MLRTVVGIASTLCLATSLACGGGGGGAGATIDGGGGAGTLLAATFVSDQASPPGAGTVGVTEAESSSNLVTLAVRVTDVADIFTVGFDVNFNPALVQYVSWAPGTLLETGGESVIYNVAPHADKVVVGASRVSPASGADVTGSQTVVRLTFRVTQAGSSPVPLTGGFLLDSQPPGPSEIQGISWSGGQILAN